MICNSVMDVKDRPLVKRNKWIEKDSENLKVRKALLKRHVENKEFSKSFNSLKSLTV